MNKDKLYQLISDLVYGEDEPSTCGIHKVVDDISKSFEAKVKELEAEIAESDKNSSEIILILGDTLAEANQLSASRRIEIADLKRTQNARKI